MIYLVFESAPVAVHALSIFLYNLFFFFHLKHSMYTFSSARYCCVHNVYIPLLFLKYEGGVYANDSRANTDECQTDFPYLTWTIESNIMTADNCIISNNLITEQPGKGLQYRSQYTRGAE